MAMVPRSGGCCAVCAHGGDMTSRRWQRSSPLPTTTPTTARGRRRWWRTRAARRWSTCRATPDGDRLLHLRLLRRLPRRRGRLWHAAWSTLTMPVLTGRAAELVDSSALSFLLSQSLLAEQEAKEAEELEANLVAREQQLLEEVERLRTSPVRGARGSPVEVDAAWWFAKLASKKKKAKRRRKKKLPRGGTRPRMVLPWETTSAQYLVRLWYLFCVSLRDLLLFVARTSPVRGARGSPVEVDAAWWFAKLASKKKKAKRRRKKKLPRDGTQPRMVLPGRRLQRNTWFGRLWYLFASVCEIFFCSWHADIISTVPCVWQPFLLRVALRVHNVEFSWRSLPEMFPYSALSRSTVDTYCVSLQRLLGHFTQVVREGGL